MFLQLIPLKISIPITTPPHGTAFDITGKNIANLESKIESFKIALQMKAKKIKESN